MTDETTTTEPTAPETAAAPPAVEPAPAAPPSVSKYVVKSRTQNADLSIHIHAELIEGAPGAATTVDFDVEDNDETRVQFDTNATFERA